MARHTLVDLAPTFLFRRDPTSGPIHAEDQVAQRHSAIPTETPQVAETLAGVRPRVLVADPIAAEGVALLCAVATVDEQHGLSPERLAAVIPDYDALVV